MLYSAVRDYRCPIQHSALELVAAVTDGDVQSGELISAEGRRYQVNDGIPYLIYPGELSAIETRTREEYDRVAEEIYDAAVDWQFAALREDENRVRESMVDMLELSPHHRVLEVGCGTGRDSFRIARRLGPKGFLYLQDVSPNMVATCRVKMAEYDCEQHFRCTLDYSISSAIHLPFATNFFDTVFHFGGFNQFGDLRRAAAEFARVVKPNGRVVFGDESVGPWLRGTEFEQIVCTNNALFRQELPINTLPENARDVSVRWIMGNCFYLIAFRKGDGTPPLDLDLPHAGWRGGTMRSRYFGVLEGVTPEAKELARQAAAKAGTSVHQWLDRLVRKQAEQDLGRSDERATKSS